MSRKAKAWVTVTTSTSTTDGDVATPKLTALQLGYSAYKPDTKTNRIRQPLVVLYHAAHVLQTTETEIASPHPAILVATMLAKLNSSTTTNSSNHKTIILVDLSALIPMDSFEEWMDEEGVSTVLEKKVSKPTCRLLEKLFMQDATLVAYGACCQLLLKIVPVSSEGTGGGGSVSSPAGHRLTSENVSKLVFLHPQLPARCINAQFRGPSTAFASGVQVHVVFSSEDDRDKRLAVLRSFFPRSEASVCDANHHGSSSMDAMLFHYLQTTTKSSKHNTNTNDTTSSSSTLENTAVTANPSSDESCNPVWEEFNPEWANEMGETIWMADVTVQMNKYTKQYEQISQVATV